LWIFGTSVIGGLALLAATASAGPVLILVIVGAFLWELAHGRDGRPYTVLAAVGGVSYLLALLVLRWRS
jgi:hypothetical protein